MLKKRLTTLVCAGAMTMGMTAVNAYAAKNNAYWYEECPRVEVPYDEDGNYMYPTDENGETDWDAFPSMRLVSYDNYGVWRAEADYYSYMNTLKKYQKTLFVEGGYKNADEAIEAVSEVRPDYIYGITNLWQNTLETGVTKWISEETLPDCIEISIELLNEEFRNTGVDTYKEVLDTIMNEFGDSISRYMSTSSPKFEKDTYHSLKNVYDAAEDPHNMILCFKNSDHRENYETAYKIAEKLAEMYGADNVVAEVCIDCHGMSHFYSDNYEVNGFRSESYDEGYYDGTGLGHYTPQASFVRIDVMHGTVLGDFVGFTNDIDIVPINTTIELPNIQINVSDADRFYVHGDEILPGDANLDAKITIADAVAIQQYLANSVKYPLTEQGLINADWFNSGDGVTGADALKIQQMDAAKTIS